MLKFGKLELREVPESIKIDENVSPIFHNPIGKKPVYGGSKLNTETLSFSIKLIMEKGGCVGYIEEKIKKIKESLRSAEPQDLIIGQKLFGKYLLSNVSENIKSLTADGYTRESVINLTFKEITHDKRKK